MEQTSLNAQVRTEHGKGPARRLRRKGLVPAVVYGRGQQPLPLAVEPTALRAAVATRLRMNTLIKLSVQGDGGGEKLAMLKDFETDPVTRELLHADFLEVRPDEQLTVEVPLVLTGKPVGVTEGGILQQARRFLDVVCLPQDIPEKIEMDVSELKIGHSLHVADVKVPGLKLKFATNFTVAVVAVPEKEEVVEVAPVPGVEGAPAVPGAPAAPGAPGAPAAPGAPGAAAAPAAGAPAPAAGAPAPAPAKEAKWKKK